MYTGTHGEPPPATHREKPHPVASAQYPLNLIFNFNFNLNFILILILILFCANARVSAREPARGGPALHQLYFLKHRSRSARTGTSTEISGCTVILVHAGEFGLARRFR